LFWTILLFLSLAFIVIHGIDFVSWPKLIPLDGVIYYTGPGYRSAHNGKGIGGGEKLKVGLSQSVKWLNSGKRRAGSRVRMEEGDIPMAVMGNKKRVD
jgi:phosphatidylinositol 4-phosphatase